jgi:hypothetical protein
VVVVVVIEVSWQPVDVFDAQSTTDSAENVDGGDGERVRFFVLWTVGDDGGKYWQLNIHFVWRYVAEATLLLLFGIESEGRRDLRKCKSVFVLSWRAHARGRDSTCAPHETI